MADKRVKDVFDDLPEDIKNSVYMLCGALSRDKFFVGAALNLLRNFKLLKKDEQEAIIFLLERAFVEGGKSDDGHS